MKPLSDVFTAQEIYVTDSGDYHRLLKPMTVKDWKELDDRIREKYPEYECIEFSTYDVDERGHVEPSTVEDWMIMWKHGMRILFRAEDYE